MGGVFPSLQCNHPMLCISRLLQCNLPSLQCTSRLFQDPISDPHPHPAQFIKLFQLRSQRIYGAIHFCWWRGVMLPLLACTSFRYRKGTLVRSWKICGIPLVFLLGMSAGNCQPPWQNLAGSCQPPWPNLAENCQPELLSKYLLTRPELFSK